MFTIDVHMQTEFRHVHFFSAFVDKKKSGH